MSSFCFRTLLALVLMSSSCASDEISVTSLAEFEQNFRKEINDAGIPGGAFAIVQEGQIVHLGSYGQRERGKNEPIDDQTIFRIASVSKTFAAELSALLVREGKLSWDDKVSRYVPQLQLSTPAYLNALQLQHLLGQSTGVVSNAYDNLLDADVPVNKILPKFRELNPLCAPGQCYTYQNILFSLIGPAIEQVTQQSYTQALQQRILLPLQMRDTSVGIDAYLAAENRAIPHIKRKGNWVQAAVRSGYYDVKPAAGLNTTAADLGKWLIAQMGGNPAVIPVDVVEQVTTKRVRTIRDMRHKHWRKFLKDAHYGLGWRIYKVGKEELYLHSGWVKGFVAEIAYSKSRRIGLVVLLNAESNVIGAITTAFWKQQLSDASTSKVSNAK